MKFNSTIKSILILSLMTFNLDGKENTSNKIETELPLLRLVFDSKNKKIEGESKYTEGEYRDILRAYSDKTSLYFGYNVYVDEEFYYFCKTFGGIPKLAAEIRKKSLKVAKHEVSSLITLRRLFGSRAYHDFVIHIINKRFEDKEKIGEIGASQ